MTTLLIDGDALVYQLAFSAETATNWADEGEEPIITVTADEAETTFRLIRAVDSLMEKHFADTAIFALSDPNANFRYGILPSYKSNRKESKKPILHERMREVVQEKFKTYLKPTLEADDTIGILATTQRIIPGPKLIISDDKDFHTINCPRARFLARKGKELEAWTPTEESALDYWMFQTLMGDLTDGYSGCPAIGKLKARRILDAALERPERKHDTFIGHLWLSVCETYEKAGLTEADALVQARVARILRFTDFDFKKGEPILWQPPTT